MEIKICKKTKNVKVDKLGKLMFRVDRTASDTSLSNLDPEEKPKIVQENITYLVIIIRKQSRWCFREVLHFLTFRSKSC